MTPEPKSSLAGSLWALILTLLAATLVLQYDWTPWETVVWIGGGALSLSLIGIIILLSIARSRNAHSALWKLFVDTVRADLQPFIDLWRFLRGPRR